MALIQWRLKERNTERKKERSEYMLYQDLRLIEAPVGSQVWKNCDIILFTLTASSEGVISMSQRPLPTQHPTNTREKHPRLQRDLNPRAPKSTGFRPTPWRCCHRDRPFTRTVWSFRSQRSSLTLFSRNGYEEWKTMYVSFG